MSNQNEAKRLARQHFEELWGNGSVGVADDLYDPSCVGHCGIAPDQTDYPSSEKTIVQRDRGGFPDAVVTLDDQIAEGDQVLTRWTMRATHSVPLFGRPATGKQVTLRGMHVHRIRDGKIVEVWAAPDLLGLFVQLGVVHEPGAADPVLANKAVVRRYFGEGFGPDSDRLVDEIVAPDYIEHGRGWFRVSSLEPDGADIGETGTDGRSGLKRTHRWLRDAFSDLHFDLAQLVAEEDRVVAYCTQTGAQSGEFQGIPPTSRRFRAQRIDIFRIAAGRIAEHWAVRDDLTQAHQLGAVAAWQ